MNRITPQDFFKHFVENKNIELENCGSPRKLLGVEKVNMVFYSDKKSGNILYIINHLDGGEMNLSNNANDYIDCIKQNINSYIKTEFKKQPLIAKNLEKLLELELLNLKWSMRHAASRVGASYNVDMDWTYKISKTVDDIQQNLLTVIDKLKDGDILKHIKNYGINFIDLNKIFDLKIKREFLVIEKSFSQDFLLKKEIEKQVEDNLNGINYNSFEGFDDKIMEILLTQKTKRFIQKTFSQRYRNLINDSTTNLMKELVMKGVDKNEFHDAFAKKMARYTNATEFNNDLKKYINQSHGWGIDNYLNKAKRLNIDVVYNKDNVIALKIDTYKQSESIGSKQWCISYGEDSFHQYHDDNEMFFFYNFNKDIDDNSSMVGIVLTRDQAIDTIHWKNDDYLHDFGSNKKAADYEKILPVIRENYDEKWYQYRWDYISQLTDTKKRNKLFGSDFSYLGGAPYLQKAMKNKLLTNINHSNLMSWIEVGYLTKECDKKDTQIWKNLILSSLQKEDFLVQEEYSNHRDLYITAMQAGDDELIDLLFNKIKDDKTVIGFDDNVKMIQRIQYKYNYNYEDMHPILDILQKNKFKLTTHEVRHLKLDAVANKDKELKSILIKYNFEPSQKNKMIP